MLELRRGREGKDKEMTFYGMTASELRRLIDERIIGRSAERDRAILKRRLIDGVTYECLAEEFNLSVRQIKTIVYKRQDQLL